MNEPQLLKDQIENLFLEESKTPKQISEILSLPLSEVESLIKYFRLEKRKEILGKVKELRKDLKKLRTKEECIQEFKSLKKQLNRTPMLKELVKFNKEGLKRDILHNFGSFSEFLREAKISIPKPIKGRNREDNFALLASEAAIRYQLLGKWSKSELKVKKILEKLGLTENLDYWHNFKIKSPLGGIFELDFYLPKWKLVLECDSFWHDIGESKEKDLLRDEWVKEKLGCKVIRFKRFNQKSLARIRKTLKEILKGV